MAKATNKLTDTEIRNAKPKEKPYKLSDGAGLYLLRKQVLAVGLSVCG